MLSRFYSEVACGAKSAGVLCLQRLCVFCEISALFVFASCLAVHTLGWPRNITRRGREFDSLLM